MLEQKRKIITNKIEYALYETARWAVKKRDGVSLVRQESFFLEFLVLEACPERLSKGSRKKNTHSIGNKRIVHY